MYIVMSKRTFNLTFRVSPELDKEFDESASKVGQTKSNLLVMLMESFVRSMDKDGHVVMPLQLKTPADCAPKSPAVHMEHNGIGHQKAVRIKAKT